MRVDVISIFPEYFAPLDVSLIGKARERGILDVRVHQLRDWAHDVHRTVDDTPYGGGPGMVMKPEPWGEAIDAVIAADPAAPPDVVPTPSGRPFTQELAHGATPRSPGCCSPAAATRASTPGSWPSTARACASTRSSIGDYVLAGGEVAVLVMVEAIGTAAARRARQRPLGRRRLLRAGRHGQPRSKGPSTPSRRSGGGTRCRPSCCPGTTGRSPGGGVTRRSAVPSPTGPSWLAVLDPETLDKHDRRLLGGAPRFACPPEDIGTTERVPTVMGWSAGSTVAAAADWQTVGARSRRLPVERPASRTIHFSTRVHRAARIAAGWTSACSRRMRNSSCTR